jgi:PKD repeat protein
MLNKRVLVLMFLLVFIPLTLVGCRPTPTPSNETPILTSYPITTATVGAEYTYDVKATDPDGDTLTYSLTVKPTGMAIDPATGLIKWTPKTKGNYAVVVKVSDGDLDITQSFLIMVSAAEPEIELTGIVVDPRTMGLFVREKEAIKSVTAYYNDGTHADITLGDCIFVSSHPYQVLVSETGVVTAVAPPSATIFVSYTERGITKMDDVVVTVSAVTLDRIVVEPDKMTLFIGQSDFIESITAHYIDGFEESIFLGDKFCKYMSSNKDIITVDDGLITAVGEGIATVTVSYFGKTDTVVATVSKPISVNQPPIASFTAIPTSGIAPLEVFFNASNSYDSDGTIISYAWDFKDGNTGNGQTINHTFSSTGSYNVMLTVIDNEGVADSVTKTITVTYYNAEADFDVCENILIAFYAALSNQNYAQALSYCKSGGATYDYVNALWDIALDWPEFYMTYQIYNVYNFSYLGQSIIKFYYDYSYTSHDIWGGIYDTKYEYGSLILFEKIYGVWKMS